MAVRERLEPQIARLEEKLQGDRSSHPPLALTPGWFQQRLLDWATTDPDFRVKLLRFVDVLPTLRSSRSVADHVRQYFRGSAPGLVQAASGLASQPVFRPVLSQIVRQGVFAMAGRFIAGANAVDAVPALSELAARGAGYTVDLLGEETLSDPEADAYAERYAALLQTLSEHKAALLPAGGDALWAGVPPVNISIKLSALCPHLEPAAPEHVSAVAGERLRPLLRLALQRGAFVNFDMEQYHYKDLAYTAFEGLLLDREFRGWPDAGIVVQAYLRDAVDDIRRLHSFAQHRGTPLSVRLVKGAYWDEENIVASQNSWPPTVWHEKQDTDGSFERCTDALLGAWPHLRPAFGTHNPRSLAQAAVKARAVGFGKSDLEFQMLFGMAEDLRKMIAGEGYRTRVYVPVGQVIPGMAYLVRRLLENTSNQAWFNMGAAVRETALIEDGKRPQMAEASLQREDGVRVRDANVLRSGDGAEGSSSERAFQNTAPARFFDPAVRAAMKDALRRVRNDFGRTYPLLIGEEEILDRSLADVAYPAAPSEIIGRVAQGRRDDAEAAVAIAGAAFPAWRDLPPTERGMVLRRAAAIMEERRFDLAAIMVFESAKPWHEADGDVIEAIDYLRYYSAQGERLAERVRLARDVLGERNEYVYEGRGVTAVISPWNFPLAIPCGMTVGALAAGNCAILKPAAQSPIIAHALISILREAGVPPAVVQYLPGPGSEVGQALAESRGVDNIAFTGSSEVGLRLIETAARAQSPAGGSNGSRSSERGKTSGTAPDRRPNVKRVIAEMGGKNAVIIDDDADLDQAIQGVIVSAFGYAGQKCSACSRLIIVGSAYEPAVERLKNAVASLVVGPPDDPATIVPPVIGADALERIRRYIESGRQSARLLVQADIGALASSGGYYVAPTVFTDVPLDAPIAWEEIFGPVLSVFRARDFEEALGIALHSDFALTGGVFSRNPRHIQQARQAFRVGNLYINRKTTGAIPGRQPFGGLHMSGVGEKAGGPDYVRQFMDARTISENTTRRGFAPEEGD